MKYKQGAPAPRTNDVTNVLLGDGVEFPVVLRIIELSHPTMRIYCVSIFSVIYPDREP